MRSPLKGRGIPDHADKALIGVLSLSLVMAPRFALSQPAPSPAATPSPTPADRATALSDVREGNRLIDAGRPAEALTHFQEAHRLVGGDKLRFNLGQALAAIPGREAEAYVEFETFLARVPGASPALIETAHASLKDLRPKVGFINLITSPSGCDVRLDGQPAGTSPLARPLVVIPGRHSLHVQKDGFANADQWVTVGAGGSRDVTIGLISSVATQPTPVALAPALAQSEAAQPSPALLVSAPSDGHDEDERPVYRRTWFWVVVGAAVVAAGVTALVIGESTSYPSSTNIVHINN